MGYTSNYFRTVVTKRTFTRLDEWMFQRAVRYARYTHPSKSWKREAKGGKGREGRP